MAWYEEGCGGLCIKVSDLLASEGRASETSGVIATVGYSRVEVRRYHHGFCDGFAQDPLGQHDLIFVVVYRYT